MPKGVYSRAHLPKSVWSFPKGVKPLAEKFTKHFTQAGEDECWLWTGAHTHAGYGIMRVDGTTRTATQISLEVAGRPRPSPNLFACHRCDNPPCVNPDHLFWGTHDENMADQRSKGRHWATVKPAYAHGHAWAPENTRIGKDGRKNCRTCENNRLASRKVVRAARTLAVNE